MGQAHVEVLFFGRMADIAGVRRIMRQADGLLALRDDLFAEALATGQVTTPAIRMSVNRQQVTDDQPLRDGDEVAFFSVFSGG